MVTVKDLSNLLDTLVVDDTRSIILVPKQTPNHLDSAHSIPPEYLWMIPLSAAGHYIIHDHAKEPEGIQAFEHCRSPIIQYDLYDDRSFSYQRTRLHDMGMTQWCEETLRGHYIVRKNYEAVLPPPSVKTIIEVWFDDPVDAVVFKMRWKGNPCE
jgi:hypothetical protein